MKVLAYIIKPKNIDFRLSAENRNISITNLRNGVQNFLFPHCFNFGWKVPEFQTPFLVSFLIKK